MSRLPTDEETANWTPHGEPEQPKRGRKKITADSAGVGDPNSLDLREQAGRTDLANGKRLVESYGHWLRYCGPWKKWLAYVDCKRWSVDNDLGVAEYAKKVAQQVWRETGQLLPNVGADVANEMVKFAKVTASARGIDNMIKMARSEPGIPVSPNELDANPWYFAADNGVIDLKSTKLIPHSRDHLLTKISPVEYPLSAQGDLCPLWLETIDKIFAGDSDVIGFFHRLLGSAMVGTVLDAVLAIFWGSGSNGKSLLVETLLAIFGDYGGKAAPDLLLAKSGNNHPTELADLYGKRLIFGVETEDGRRLSESVAKELTGGDSIKARRMREDFWEFTPQHTIILATNHKPRVRGSDHAIWRRLRLVPFTRTFWDEGRGETGDPELKADKHLRERLKAEYSGILHWLVQGCLEWQRVGLGEPDAVRAATGEYKSAEDTLAQFFNECCAWPVERCRTSAVDLRAEYEKWCKRNGEKPFSSRRLGEWMTNHGVERVRSNGIHYEALAIVGTTEGSSAF